MSILTASYVSQSFGADDIFRGISAGIPNDGKVGLVGPNGVGKTTLLRILAGESEPTAGAVHIAKNIQLGYLSQQSSRQFSNWENRVYDEMLLVFADVRGVEEKLRQIEGEMAENDVTDVLFEQYSRLQEAFELAGGYDYEVRIKQVLTGLGFGQDKWQLRLNHLSGGQRTRVRLARLLLEQPDLLILDEPTNHLDVEAIEWLEGVLQTWQGALLVVSHDRYFLDKVVNTIWEMTREGLETYRGNYTAYLKQREERWERKAQTFKALRERLDKEMDFIRRNIAGQRTQMAKGKLSRLAREVEAIHLGGLEMMNKDWSQVRDELGMISPAQGVAELQQRINELRGPRRPPQLHISLPASHRSGHIVLRAKGVEIGYPGTPLFKCEPLELHRRECAALIGPNGTGKSTFLQTILGQLAPLQGDITLGASLQLGYFSQAHEELNLENNVLDELLGHENMGLREARNYLAQYLFRGDDVYKLVGSLSGGEKGRLSLAILALEEANFLLLDEPTNHLDIPAQEALQQVLEGFDGTILMVSHDRYLIDRLATQLWIVENGRLQVFKGPYRAYVAQQAEVALVKQVVPPKKRNNGEGLSKNALRQRAERITAVEERITTMEAALVALSEAMEAATQTQNFDKIQGLSLEYEATESALQNLMDEWEMLANE